MRGFVKGDLKTCVPENMVSYATGRRKDSVGGGFIDAEGTGPGMYHALWVAQVLASSGQDCFSGLCVGGGKVPPQHRLDARLRLLLPPELRLQQGNNEGTAAVGYVEVSA